mmetsp:Transcript_83234/g.166556  ORF Transcript_83234/g.166556 Transcript_83234/m.166556 type:complete len:245 (-) Transcript_83234:556-1290(-)
MSSAAIGGSWDCLVDDDARFFFLAHRTAVDRVEAEPTKRSLCLARDKRTFTRRLSSKSVPTSPVALECTVETSMHALSRPWYLSMVVTSIFASCAAADAARWLLLLLLLPLFFCPSSVTLTTSRVGSRRRSFNSARISSSCLRYGLVMPSSAGSNPHRSRHTAIPTTNFASTSFTTAPLFFSSTIAPSSPSSLLLSLAKGAEEDCDADDMANDLRSSKYFRFGSRASVSKNTTLLFGSKASTNH